MNPIMSSQVKINLPRVFRTPPPPFKSTNFAPGNKAANFVFAKPSENLKISANQGNIQVIENSVFVNSREYFEIELQTILEMFCRVTRGLLHYFQNFQDDFWEFVPQIMGSFTS